MYRGKKIYSIKRLLAFGGAFILVLIGILAALQFTGVVHFFSHKKPAPIALTGGQSTKGEHVTPNSNSIPSSATSSNASNPGTIKQDTAPNTVLIPPTGNFVSAHKNVPMSASLSSVCNTSAGAKCQIVFTSNNLTRSLPAQTTDLGGATYWPTWTPTSIGLTPGTWQIAAIATLGNSTKSSTDALNLEIVQ